MRQTPPHLDPNCLQRPSKFGFRTERVKRDFLQKKRCIKSESVNPADKQAAQADL
ncbi:hypothetical protein DPMN_044801 [Dreissena polymorpha]|uniref:Uncharacterized protein n=1 Tax=Dreissena polymorpha TaxID=45954 RepID=A0A9D4HZ50_DREPO|nr:hypothetical protein DPMN_044801 [Dreissena polymorpha]